ncbi:serine protease 56 isoform X1 [Anguilla rostrata]|uniref:serine protease 56 isoform X1 n=1 Tax=Anguilla rostrata TaxID=7938 RepID=UPI0030D26AAC
MLLLASLLLMIFLDCRLAAPAGREVYTMPQSALQALSDRGTVVLEAALASALSALEQAVSDRSRAESGCRGCVPCLFQDCGQRSGPCGHSPDAYATEPSCEVISQTQRLLDERERNWALSQACGFYRRRCPATELGKESCIRVMGESCSARVLQCSLLNTMNNLEPAPQTKIQAVCGQRVPAVQNLTQPRSRIVGGSLAPPGSWPWLVNLRLDGGMMCGAVLVDSSWVVTAAHCFSGSRSENYWTAVVGEFDITKTDPEEQVMRVNRIITHPKFNPKTFNNDIALVELTSPVVLSDRVSPVCVPSGQEPPVGTPCLVAGWGSMYEDGPPANTVMEAKVPLLPQNTCKNALGKDLVTNTMFCAGYLSGGIDSCQGDSGGPLIYPDRISGRFHLYGITSWGDGCGEKGKPGVYTRVTAFSDWILAEIQKSSGSREPTCPELLKTSELSEEQQRSEFRSLCRFYTLTCPHSQGAAACIRMTEDKCYNRYKKCQLHSFLQTLLDLLQRAEDYIRDKVDLTFFTQTLPQLVEHIYSTAFPGRERRQAPAQTEQVGVTAAPEEVGLHSPPLFEEVGPLVNDWANYLRGIAEVLNHNPTSQGHQLLLQEKKLFLQGEDGTLHQLEGEYRSLINQLRSRLGPAVALANVSADPTVQQDRDISSSAGAERAMPSHTSAQSQGTISTSIVHAAQEFGEQTTKTPSEIPATDASWDRTMAHSQKVSWLNPPLSSGSAPHMDTPDTSEPMTSDPTQMPQLVAPTLYPFNKNPAPRRQTVQRRRRGLHKRQLSGVNNKVCPGVVESTQQVSVIRQSYRWVLAIPSKNLSMNFQEVLVDLASKNERGLYEARIRAMVAGRPLTFYSLVGLESEAFYRSMPRVIAMALDTFKA